MWVFYFAWSLNLKLYGSPIYECWCKALIFTYKNQKILNMNEKWFSHHHTLFDATYITNLKSSCVRACMCGCICMCIHAHIQTHTHLVLLIYFLHEIWHSHSGVAESYWQFHLTTPGSFFGNLSPEIDVLVLHKTFFSSD